ncbi:DUF960 domain-containing protein [Bacillus safensis]|uniref:DUF960 domain-containing protein n=1 Tax=Bacillus safensis TaxID=561879 RepID=UPI003916E5E9
MFSYKNGRYMTRAIADCLHMEIQKLLWDLIDHGRKQGEKLDYLQVFELEKRENQQRIIHRQEVPERKREWLITLKSTPPAQGTVWCIDDETHQTMLFPSDY